MLLAPQLLTALSNVHEVQLYLQTWAIARVVSAIQKKYLVELAEFTQHENTLIQKGACHLWEGLVAGLLTWKRHMRLSNRDWQKIKSLRFDWQIGLSLVGDADMTKRRQGITLLTLSDFPVADAAHCAELLNAMAKTQDGEESTAWVLFLQEIPIPEPRKVAWLELLRSILGQPRTYPYEILQAAMERYVALVGEAGPDIVGDEKALGLALVSITLDPNCSI